MAPAIDQPWSGRVFSPPTPLDIGTIENAIVERLRAAISSIEVARFPGEPGDYRMTHRVGAALVVYRGSTYGEVTDTAAVAQERRMEFDVTVLVRDLGWGAGGGPSGTSPGAYAILESVRLALTGFQVPGARKMRLVRERFVERDRQGGVFIYVITVALSTVVVEPSIGTDFPLFVKGVALESGGETTVTLGASPFSFDSNDQIELPHLNVIALSLSTLDGIVRSPGIDYSLDGANGLVIRIGTGGIAAGATVNIAWSYADAAVAAEDQAAPTA